MDPKEKRLRSLMEAWNLRDPDAALAQMGPEPVYVNPPNAVEPGTRRGRDEFLEVFRKQWEMLGDARWSIERIHIQGDEAIVEGSISRGMPDSTARIENRGLLKAVFDGDLIQRVEALGAGSDYDEALKAAGLGDE